MISTDKILEEFDIKQRLFLGGRLHSTAFNKWFVEMLTTKVAQAIAEERAKLLGEIRKRRDSLSMSTKFAVMMMNQRGDAGKMVKELRELGGYQAIDELLSSLDKPKK